MSDQYPVEQKPRDLADQGTKGVMATAGGTGLLIVNSLLGVPVVGWVLSVGMLVLGLTGLSGKTKTDKVSGGVFATAGVLGGVSLLLPGVTRSLLGLGGIGLLIYGLFNLGGFVSGLRKKKNGKRR
ncbi:MAG: hypothetical protein LLF89_04120 [Spirochaetaceae bacterium]|nr:hypothetical protein [Spirochaetaceae bacterium]